jgi:hypothetical protein
MTAARVRALKLGGCQEISLDTTAKTVGAIGEMGLECCIQQIYYHKCINQWV